MGLRPKDFTWRVCFSAAGFAVLKALAACHSCKDVVLIFKLWLKRNFLLRCWAMFLDSLARGNHVPLAE